MIFERILSLSDTTSLSEEPINEGYIILEKSVTIPKQESLIS